METVITVIAIIIGIWLITIPIKIIRRLGKIAISLAFIFRILVALGVI